LQCGINWEGSSLCQRLETLQGAEESLERALLPFGDVLPLKKTSKFLKVRWILCFVLSWSSPRQSDKLKAAARLADRDVRQNEPFERAVKICVG